MTQFFDILAGTSIGGLISAILTVPSEEYPGDVAHPKYSSNKALDLMTTKGGIIFDAQTMKHWEKWTYGALIAGYGAIMFYFIGRSCFRNRDLEK